MKAGAASVDADAVPAVRHEASANAVAASPLLDSPTLDDPLSALLGSTRAQALRTLLSERTTSELARDLAVTTAAASMQAKILREAGLIIPSARGRLKAVWHRCTPLGVDLITAPTRVATGRGAR